MPSNLFQLQRRQVFGELVLVGLVAITLVTVPLTVALPVILAAAGALVFLLAPWLIWPMLALILPFSSALHLGPLTVTDLLLLAAVGLWFVDGVRRRILPLQLSVIPLLALLYAAVLLLSTLQATDLGEAFKEVIKWMELAAVLLLIPAMTPRWRIGWLVAGLLLAGVCQALLGLYQFLFRIGPDWFVILGRFMRARGSFAQPNPYAGYLGLVLPVAVSLAVWSLGNLWRGRQVNNPRTVPGGRNWVQSSWLRLALAAACTVASLTIAIGLLASWSRGGWLGALAGIGVVIVFRSRTTVVLGMGLLTILLMSALLGTFSPEIIPEPIAARMSNLPAYIGASHMMSDPITDENFAVIERVAHWIAAVRMWELAPWLGIGPGNYAVAYPDVRLTRWEDALGHAHNIYLNVLAETGIIGLSAFLLLWIGALVWLISGRRRLPKPGWGDALTLGVVGVLVHLAVHSGFDNLFVQGLYIQLGLWLTAVHVVVDSATDKQSSIGTRSSGVYS